MLTIHTISSTDNINISIINTTVCVCAIYTAVISVIVRRAGVLTLHRVILRIIDIHIDVLLLCVAASGPCVIAVHAVVHVMHVLLIAVIDAGAVVVIAHSGSSSAV